MVRDPKLIGILNGTALDCGQQPDESFLTFGWSVRAVKPSGRVAGGVRAEWWHGKTFDKNMSKYMPKHQFSCFLWGEGPGTEGAEVLVPGPR
jgi:hypothetical protein